MKLSVLGSSSRGNCYIFDNGNEALIIEAGVNFRDVKRALGFNLRKVAGCLVTHVHNDHAKHVTDIAESGIRVLALGEVLEAKGVNGTRAVAAVPGRGMKLGNFRVMPFSACHDVPCLGYLVEHDEFGRLLFLTDSFMCEYTFPGLNHIMVECNYSDSVLLEAIAAGRTLLSQRERLMTSHMELETCANLLRSNDLGGVQEIILLHLSADNSNERQFVSYIEGVTGKAVYAAGKGLEIELSRP